MRSTELVGCPAHISQAANDLETIAAIAVTDLEPCGAVAELLAKAVPVHFLAVFLHGAGNDLVVVDVVAEFFDVVWIRLGSVPDAEFSYVAASPRPMDWLRPIWKDELIITGVPSRDRVMWLSGLWIISETECACELFRWNFATLLDMVWVGVVCDSFCIIWIGDVWIWSDTKCGCELFRWNCHTFWDIACGEVASRKRIRGDNGRDATQGKESGESQRSHADRYCPMNGQVQW